VSSPSLLVTAAVPNAITGMLQWLEDDLRTTSGILEADMMMKILLCLLYFAIASLFI
jgi:hypothetical protein